MASKKPAKGKGSAKKKAALRTSKTSGSSDTGNAVFRPIGERALKDLADLADRCLLRSSQASGDLGQAISDYQEKGLNPVAFRIVHRLRRLGHRDPIKLRGVLDNIDYYRDVLKLDELKATDMFLDEQSEKTPRERKKKEETQVGADPDQLDLEKDAMPTDESSETGTEIGNVHSLDEHRGAA